MKPVAAPEGRTAGPSPRLSRWIWAGAVLAGLTLPAGPAAAAVAWDRNHLQTWVGQVPSARRPGAPVHLFDEPGLRSLIERAVPAHERRLLRRMRVESPVTQAADLLLAPVCMAHACPAEHAVLAVDLARRQIWLGMFTRSAAGTATRWYSSSASVEVPDAALREFKSRHAP